MDSELIFAIFVIVSFKMVYCSGGYAPIAYAHFLKIMLDNNEIMYEYNAIYDVNISMLCPIYLSSREDLT